MIFTDPAVVTQLANLEKRSGKTLAELAAIVRGSGLARHGEQVAMLKRDLGMGHGDANLLAHYVRNLDAQAAGVAPPSGDDAVAALYTGKKAHLRPIHDALMAQVNGFGAFETAPRKTYVSLRRKKQFATIGPATNTQLEVGLNVKSLAAHERLVQLPPKGMCDYKTRLSSPAEVDAILVGWLRKAYEAAGH
jgi:hypothetical protein